MPCFRLDHPYGPDLVAADAAIQNDAVRAPAVQKIRQLPIPGHACLAKLVVRSGPPGQTIDNTAQPALERALEQPPAHMGAGNSGALRLARSAWNAAGRMLLKDAGAARRQRMR